MTLQRLVQAASLGLFLALLWLAAFPMPEGVPVDLFLRLDPLVLVGTTLAAREFVASLWPGLLVLASAVVAGRVFCGYVCPMGATLDASDAMGGLASRKPASDRTALPGWLRRTKHHLLLLILGSAAVGVSLVFLASPIPLITRFYGVVVHPLLTVAAAKGAGLLQPLAGALDWRELYYAQVQVRRFQTLLFVLAFFGGLFWLGRVRPRFWCRYLCPAGAMLALLSVRPLLRRRLDRDACLECGKCRRRCPMGAVAEDFTTTASECLLCRTCARECPAGAITFTPRDARLREAFRPAPFLPSRRGFLTAGAAGAGLAAVTLTGLNTLQTANGPGGITDAGLIRPPGAVPESDFLTRCLRCGECLKACPTNTLQPVWFSAGLGGVFSPVVVPRRAPCEAKCNSCGQVCPTGAIRAVDLAEKQKAKIGTAYILRHKCLAWEQKRRCVVCQEVCPYGAIESRFHEGSPVSVPFVRAEKCYGCGFCEHHCPVRAASAIVVEPLGAIRLAEGSYADKAVGDGLKLEIADKTHVESYPAGAPYGGAGGGLPPGFTE